MRKFAQQPEEFNKKDWILSLKALKKDYVVEDRERYRPLLNVKRDCKDFVEEIEKEEKKAEITCKKEYASLIAIITKHKAEVDQAKNMIT